MADRIKGITIEIGGDTTGLNKALNGVNKEIRNTQSQLRDVERLLKMDPSNTELLKQKQKLLADAVNETSTKLEALKTAEKQAQEQFKQGKISEEQYDALKREIIATEQQLDSLTEKANKSNVAMQKIGLAGEKVKDFGGKVTSAGEQLSKVSAGIAAVGAASVAAWEQIDEAYDTIAKGTGTTGTALEGLQKSFDNVFAKVPTDAAEAGSAIADINTRFGFTGEVLEDCTGKFIKFSEVNGIDVSTSIAKVSRYMGDAGIESEKYGEVLDQLTAASQASGIGMDKLTENLTKYGAPMRALGLTTEESIAIFAGWEKAGVNTEIAFAGMKKAIGTWGKEGKDATKEFKKTLNEIEKCPDIASATAKAIEVFGQKAGPDLADAIKGGRFEYEDFLDVIAKSGGQLEQTFQSTLDPIDDVKLSMQQLTKQGAELGGELLKTISPMITELIDKLKTLTTWFSGLSESQKEMVIKSALLVAALGPVLIVVGQIITGIGGLMTMFSGLGTAMVALSASGGPLFLTLLAISGLATAFIIAKDNANSYKEEAWEVSEAEKENIESVDALNKSYEELIGRRKESISGIESQIGYENSLWQELKNITDENGKVKKGYEDRAAFITQTLSQALDTEIQMTSGVIENYKSLQDEIDGLIEKKRQEALMNAYQEEYAQGIKDRKTAQKNLAEAISSSQAATDGYNSSLQTENALQAEYNRLMEQYAKDGTNDAVRQQLYDLQDQMIQSGEATEGFCQKMETMNENLSNAQSAWEGINSTIANYEGASAAIISGDQEKIAEALTLMEYGFKNAEVSTTDSLKAQHESIKTELANAKKAMEEGAAGIDQAYISGLEQMEAKARIELAKTVTTSGKAAEEAAKIVLGKRGDMVTAGDELASGVGEGIKNRENDVKAAATAITDTSSSQLQSNTPLSPVWGSDMMSGYIQGIKNKIGELSSACQSVARTVYDYMHFTRPEKGPLRNYEEWMPHMMQGLARGINENLNVVGNAAGNAAKEIGSELAVGIADGVKNNKENAKKNAEDLAKAVLDAAQKRLKNHEVYNQISLADEVDYWDAVRKQVTEGTQARIDADEQYYKAKTDMNKKMLSAEETYTDNVADAYEKLNKEIKDLNNEYKNAVESRATEIKNAFGLFDKFEMSTDLTADDLLNNLQGQVDGIRSWRKNLDDLEARGIGEDLLEELRQLGPRAAAEIQLMTDMSDEQLDEYVSLFKQKNNLARRQAVEELEPMRDEISEQIAQLQRDTASELAKYQQEYTASIAELGLAINQPMESMKLVAAQNAIALVTSMADSVKDASGNVENVEKFKEIAKNVLGATQTLPESMLVLGQSAIESMISGINSMAGKLYEAVAVMVGNAVNGAIDAALYNGDIDRALAAGAGYAKTASGPGEQQNQTGTEIMSVLSSYLPEIAKQKSILLNGKTLVGKTATDMDGHLVVSQNVKERVG